MLRRLVDQHPRQAARAAQLFNVLACYYANREGVAYPSRRRLARDMAVSADTVDRMIKVLGSVGALDVQRRLWPNGERRSNRFRVRFAPPPGR